MVGKPNKWVQTLPNRSQPAELMFTGGGTYVQTGDRRVFGPKRDMVEAIKLMMVVTVHQSSGTTR